MFLEVVAATKCSETLVEWHALGCLNQQTILAGLNNLTQLSAQKDFIAWAELYLHSSMSPWRIQGQMHFYFTDTNLRRITIACCSSP